jgi:hypothetical protein
LTALMNFQRSECWGIGVRSSDRDISQSCGE